MRPKRDEAFRLVMNQSERIALQQLAETEGMSQAAIVRRLVRIEATRTGIWPPPSAPKVRASDGVRP
jgi:hypothetical protein